MDILGRSHRFHDLLPVVSCNSELRTPGHSYGIRVPALTISPYAKSGHIDHQPLSYDAYLKFIEDDFLDGARLNPTADGHPDLPERQPPRPERRMPVNPRGRLPVRPEKPPHPPDRAPAFRDGAGAS